MKIYSSNSNVSYSIIILLIISQILSYEASLCVSFAFIFYLFVRQKFDITNTHIIGFGFLVNYLIIAAIVGLLYLDSYGGRPFIRDIFYVLSAIITMLLGFYLFISQGAKKDIVKTMIAWAAMLSGIMLVKIIINMSLIWNASIWAFNSEVSACSEIIPISLAILLMRSSFNIKRFFTRKTEGIFIFLYVIAMVFSFSRTNLGVFMLSLIVLFICAPNKEKVTLKAATRILFGTIAISCGLLVVLYLTNIFAYDFIAKVARSIVEISPNLDWNNDANIIQNWRGYEIKQATTIFKDGTLFNHFFGFGFGKLIPVRLSELVGVQNNLGGIPILHNGYYMILIKGGVFGIFMLGLFFFKNIIVATKKIKSNISVWESSLLLVIIFDTIFTTYIITGLFKAGTPIETNLLLGWLNGIIAKNLKSKYGKNKKYSTIN